MKIKEQCLYDYRTSNGVAELRDRSWVARGAAPATSSPSSTSTAAELSAHSHGGLPRYLDDATSAHTDAQHPPRRAHHRRTTGSQAESTFYNISN